MYWWALLIWQCLSEEWLTRQRNENKQRGRSYINHFCIDLISRITKSLGNFTCHDNKMQIHKAFSGKFWVLYNKHGQALDRCLLDNELEVLNELDSLWLPVVNAQGPILVDGTPALLYERFALESKNVVRLVNKVITKAGSSPLLNQRSIDDLTSIRKTMIEKNIWVNDLQFLICLLYTSPSPRDATLSRMPSSA